MMLKNELERMLEHCPGGKVRDCRVIEALSDPPSVLSVHICRYDRLQGDIALIACFAASWTPAMIRRWNADPFGFLRPWNEVPALMASAPPATPPSTGTGVVTFLMG
jgi:hypothetical protein